MTATNSHAKKRPAKLSEADKRAAAARANRKAQLQWYAVGAAVIITVVAVIVLISIYTDGELPNYEHN